MAEELMAEEEKAPASKRPLTLPAGPEARFPDFGANGNAVQQTADKAVVRLYTALNKGVLLQDEATLGGEERRTALQQFTGTRIAELTVPTAADRKEGQKLPYIRLGGLKLDNSQIAPGSTLMSFQLMPDAGLQMIGLVDTQPAIGTGPVKKAGYKPLIITGEDGVLPTDTDTVRNDTGEIKRVIVVIPPDRSLTMMQPVAGRKASAGDFEEIDKKGMQLASDMGLEWNDKAKRFVAQKKFKGKGAEAEVNEGELISKYEELYEEIVTMKRNMQESPGQYSAAEKGAIFDALEKKYTTVKEDAKTLGIFDQTFIKKTSLAKDALQEMKKNVISTLDTEVSEESTSVTKPNPERAFASADAIKTQLQESMRLAGAKSMLPNDLTGALKKPGGSLGYE